MDCTRLAAGLALIAGCGDTVRTEMDPGGTGGASASPSSTTGPVTPDEDDGDAPEAGTSGTTSGSSEDSGSSGPGPFDPPPLDVGGPPLEDSCTVPKGELDAAACNWTPPDADDAFNPEVQWTWSGSNGDVQSVDIPLIANLTDDNDDGAIDLCDTPDVVVLACPDVIDDPVGRLHVLDGETGEEHFYIPQDLKVGVTPALGDIDGDGLVEIVAVTVEDELVAFEHDGSVAWSRPVPFLHYPFALAIADLDADGTPEIFGDNQVVDATGEVLFGLDLDWSMAATAADLDDDGTLEVIFGTSAYRHDGTPHYLNAPGERGSMPHVADFDDDGEPEILTTTLQGLVALRADGSPIFSGLNPSGVPGGATSWMRPAAIHDFNGDGAPQVAMSSHDAFSVFSLDTDAGEVAVVWSRPVLDVSGIAAGTGFDFLGDAVAEAMYADETTMHIFDGGGGEILLESTRASRTLIEYPVVADIDNDESAEIVVVSNEFIDAEEGDVSPTVSVIRNASDRWVPARRVWNQHTYHVTNVREDGRIPPVEPQHWNRNNTFRTNAQIADGAVCEPVG